MTSEKVIEKIRAKFQGEGAYSQIPVLSTLDTFNATLRDEGIYVNNLGTQHFLPWVVFTETFMLLRVKGGKVLKGNAEEGILGDEKLPLDSVEGYIACGLYGKMVEERVFPRILPISEIMNWAGITKTEGDYMILV